MGDDPVNIGFVRSGYMFLASKEKEHILRQNSSLQNSLGAKTKLLEPYQL